MSITQFPGVGPTNTDIANAVVTAGTSAGFAATGPTTTQIAAAVPNLTQITSAITSNAASAGVTLAAIGTQVANNATRFVGTYTTLVNQSLATGVNSFNVTGLGGYRYLRIMVNAGFSSNDRLAARLNGDSGFNYYYNVMRQDGSSMLNGTTQINTMIGTTSTMYNLEIWNANSTTSVKTYSGNAGSPTTGDAAINGMWNSNSAISSIFFFSENGNTLSTGWLTIIGGN